MNDKIAKPEDVLEFWANAGSKKWWVRDNDFDTEIKHQFETTHEHAKNGNLTNWLETPDTTLALVIVLDQFSRNLFRDDAKAFAQDAQCVAIVQNAISNGYDRQMREDIGMFIYLPLMHSESISDQEQCVKEMGRLELEDQKKFAKIHLDIIEKFGRFPHRNKLLGRATTMEEQIFLNEGGFSR